MNDHYSLSPVPFPHFYDLCRHNMFHKHDLCVLFYLLVHDSKCKSLVTTNHVVKPLNLTISKHSIIKKVSRWFYNTEKKVSLKISFYTSKRKGMVGTVLVYSACLPCTFLKIDPTTSLIEGSGTYKLVSYIPSPEFFQSLKS